MNTPQSHLLLSPNGNSAGQQHQFASLDPYDTASNHSGHSSSQQKLQTAETTYSDTNLSAIPSSSASSATIPAAAQPAKKNFNSEYKSKFRPFSQYAYNEVTDSFVKQPSAANSISASRSNQDLSGGADAHQITTISAHEADVFEPTNGQIEGAGAATVEPWYKEVQKRNEKAHEYRFKSEVGHNSPLLNYNRSESPFSQTERQIVSPSGNESIVGENSNLNEVRSQHSDQLTTEGNSHEQQASKTQYRFTPYDYKRDNLIAHMANNNNFNLPKEQLESASSSKVQPRRLMSSSTASSRARSQSSRRQPTAAGGASTATSKAQPASKSNQATPTRSVGSRSNVTMRATTASSATKTPTIPRYATTTRTPASSRPTANGSSGVSSTTKTPTQISSASKRTPTVSASKITPKQVGSSVSSSTKTAPISSAKKTAAQPNAARPTLSASSRPKTAGPIRPASGKQESPIKATSAGIKPGKLPNPNAWSSSLSTRTTPASKEKTLTPKTAGATSAVKSIKTRKAIESETAKKAAAAAAGVAVAAAVTAAAVAVAPSDPEESTVAPVDPITDQREQVQANLRYAPEEQNLIFTTTEAGDMLADELAQAELAASNNSRPEQQAFVQETHQQPEVQEATTLVEEKIDRPAEESQTGELINGLAGGLVSAEDRFDSSERDCSVDTTNDANQSSMQQEQNFNDEPYSIIPTSADNAAAQQFEAATSSEIGDLTYIKAPDAVSDLAALQDDKDPGSNPSEIGESTHREPSPDPVDSTDLLHETHGENENFGGAHSDVSYDDDAINTSGAAALTEDQELMVSTPKCTDNLNKEDGKPASEEILLAGNGTSSKSNDNDLTHGESEDIIDSSPALISANTTLQGDELDLSATTSNPPNADASPSSNDNNNSNTNVDSETNLVQLALETHDVEVSRHELDSKTLLQNDDVAEFGETSGNVNSQSFSGFESSQRDELLMNVADLIDAESRKKQEMARKSELAKRDSSPIPAGEIGEVLLSPLQLDEQFAALSVDETAPMVPDDANKVDINEDLDGKQNEKFNDDNEHSQIQPTEGSDIMGFDRDDNMIKHYEFKGNNQDLFGVMETGKDEHDDNFTSQAANATFSAGLHEVESDQAKLASEYTETITPKTSQVNLDDIDNDEHLKLSNHLTNSDDELILQPGNQKSTNDDLTESTQQQQQHQVGESDLDLMAEEDRIEGTVELGDGTSAALDVPTSIENRVEMSTSKSTDEPELPQANFKFARKMSDDSDEELDINPDDDPIGSAATLSPNTSVAEELMRFNAVKDNILDLAMARITDDEHFSEMTSSNDRVHNNNGSTKDTIESVNVTSHVIDETVKQLSEQ